MELLAAGQYLLHVMSGSPVLCGIKNAEGRSFKELPYNRAHYVGEEFFAAVAKTHQAGKQLKFQALLDTTLLPLCGGLAAPHDGGIGLCSHHTLTSAPGPARYQCHCLELEVRKLECSACTFLASLGASSGIIDLLPSPSAATNWTAGLRVDSSEMIFKFDGRQGAKIPDGIVPKNLTDQFTITMWMKHGPSPGVRAEKETILCNSDKTGESLAQPFHRHPSGCPFCPSWLGMDTAKVDVEEKQKPERNPPNIYFGKHNNAGGGQGQEIFSKIPISILGSFANPEAKHGPPDIGRAQPCHSEPLTILLPAILWLHSQER
ncbi:hypothetical protein P7K49_031679 [Saguinus oedipus]|uniref:Uncharacterized protein n=1 Tax=Saguinus oedipus TaxID=9490 RepID=A0ABQ9U036_SAGOE|nr:hypothetical protein P7K49_031679 [Saguinus oedipus]